MLEERAEHRPSSCINIHADRQERALKTGLQRVCSVALDITTGDLQPLNKITDLMIRKSKKRSALRGIMCSANNRIPEGDRFP